MFKADLVVHAAGRVPDLDPLELAAAGVASEKGRLKLNEFASARRYLPASFWMCPLIDDRDLASTG